MRNIYFLFCFFLTTATVGSFSSFFDLNLTASTAGENSYAVEIARLKSPLDVSYFENVDGVFELNTKNGEYSYLSGLRTNKKDAKEILDKIKSNGYLDAEIVNLHSNFSSQQIANIPLDEKEKFFGSKRKEAETKGMQKEKKAELADVKLKSEQVKAKKILASKGLYNMGRKMRGKEYVDYFYDLAHLDFSEKAFYKIELGPYDDKELANETLGKLKELGFSELKVNSSNTKNTIATTPYFAIQVLACKSQISAKQLRFKKLKRTFDQEDELYRYFYGQYDNYWLCRRELREVRKKGYVDAFIVKL